MKESQGLRLNKQAPIIKEVEGNFLPLSFQAGDSSCTFKSKKQFAFVSGGNIPKLPNKAQYDKKVI